MELNIDNLIIEVTRKCNMKCQHCLRGSAQRKVISNHYIHKMMALIDNVGTITISGGEPTLAMDKLHYIRECIIYGDIDVQNFYMVTNGKSIPINDLAEWVYLMELACSDNEISSVGFSFDRFHVQTLNYAQMVKQENNYNRLKDKLEWEYGVTQSGCGGDFITKHSDNSWGYDSLISEGRAKEMGVKSTSIDSFEEDNWNDNIQFTETELYLSCSGYIVAGCNWSYKSVDNKKDIRICHIDDINCREDLIEAIRVYNKRVKKEEKQLV